MTFDASANTLTVDRVILRRVVGVIEGDFAPLVIDAVRGQLDLSGLFFAFFRYLIL